ncbi:solute carrier family 2, facilitated glucose transporter member 5 isoform X5 [Physeter macrocephalus]|uniref:Solute carrier family 2, facilitated glucose transporter member 5 n=1 Tax=Physeter macrocephalus TaxID=9755 RepID=A0A455BIA5_PHYMC|nr:solute carrier family 2, facilitated glucose transporter member 5 isoform X5 [Physeter catodon]|eukprot:XP_028343676.1 solute carrier family 2, facilitated glucose transporter member 5 isoform X4 [Physeter catodon]
MSPPAPPTELVPSERAVVLLSCALSALGSGLLVATHALWPDLRSRARRLLLFLSLADLLSAVSYFYGVLQDFEGPSWDCVLQGALSTFANTSSFFWTVAIALYLYLSIVRTSRGPGDGRLLWAFHVVSWGVPLVITVAAVALKKIGYDASDVSVGWCWVDLEAEDRVLWLLLTGKAWELLAYVTLPVLYLLIRKHIRRARLTPVLALATLIAAFGSSFQYGYNVAVINSPAKLMKAFYNETYYDRISEYISEFSLTLLWSVSVSMFPFGGFLGSLMVGPLVNKLGRKGTLLFNNIFSIVPAILMGCSEVARSFEMIIVARLLVGICAGLSSNVVPMYLGELAPKNLRGALGVVPQLFITVGILAAQILGLRSLLANEEGWPTLLGVTGVPAALQLLLLPFFPESPRYLLIQKRDEAAAKTGTAFPGEATRVAASSPGGGARDSAPGGPSAPPPSAEGPARLGRRGRRDAGDPGGGQGREGRGLHLRAEAAPEEVAAVAGHLRRRPHGRPAAVGSERDLLLRRPDLPERWGESTGRAVCDGGHGRGQRADDRLRRFRGGASGEESPAPPRFLHLLHRLLRADGRPGSAGHNILDALRQHRVHHLLCHRTCPWAQPYPCTAHHRDLPAVLPAGRLHGGGQCPLALQLHCGLDLPIHPSGPRSLQLYRFCRDMSSHHHLHLPGCTRDQVQDLHRNQSDLHQDEQSVRGAPRKGGAKGLSSLYCGAVTREEEPVNQVDPSPTPRHAGQLSLNHAGSAIVWLVATPALIMKTITAVSRWKESNVAKETNSSPIP